MLRSLHPAYVKKRQDNDRKSAEIRSRTIQALIQQRRSALLLQKTATTDLPIATGTLPSSPVDAKNGSPQDKLYSPTANLSAESKGSPTNKKPNLRARIMSPSPKRQYSYSDLKISLAFSESNKARIVLNEVANVLIAGTIAPGIVLTEPFVPKLPQPTAEQPIEPNQSSPEEEDVLLPHQKAQQNLLNFFKKMKALQNKSIELDEYSTDMSPDFSL